MKKVLFVLALGAFAACNNGDTKVNVSDSAAADTTVVVVPDTTTVISADTTSATVDTTKH
jgi:hypothetical protein